MQRHFSDKNLVGVLSKIEQGTRLDFDDGVLLYQSNDLPGIGRLADMSRRARHGSNAYYVVNRHVNYTNVCINRCGFCAFARDGGQEGAFTLSLEQVREMLRFQGPLIPDEVHMVGGLNPALPPDFYFDLLKTIRETLPTAAIKAFTAVEIDYLAGLLGLSPKDTLLKLKASGLSMLPGGGAEVMSDRIQEKLFPKKITYRRWLEIMRTAHELGIFSNATMLYGHIETIEERVAHLLKLRELQDQTGGFTAFIPLAFHPKNTQLSHLGGTTGFTDLKTIAISRLLLDNFSHIKAYWVMIGEKLAQVALSFGADDLDGTIVEEKITHMAGATSAKGLTPSKMESMIAAAGFEPVRRDAFYNPVTSKGGRGEAF